MARPATGQTPVKTFRPPKPLWNEVMQYVKAEGRPYGDVIIEALHDWLKKKHREGPPTPDAPSDPGSRG